MALTAQFGGGSLPTGWTFVQNGAANATIDNSGESADILIPAEIIQILVYCSHHRMRPLPEGGTSNTIQSGLVCFYLYNY